MESKSIARKLIILLIILTLIIVSIYFVPRLITVGKFINQHGIPKKYEDIGFIEVFEGVSVNATTRDVEISLPVHNQEKEDLYEPYTASEGVTTLWGNDYEITIYRSEDEPLYVNVIIHESMRKFTMHSDNYIEYMIKTLETQYEDLNIFQSLDKLQESYMHYGMKSSLLKYMGPKYCIFDNGNGYLYFAMMSESDESSDLIDELSINVYDMEHHYNLEATIEISKTFTATEGLTEEDARFIVLNMKILESNE